jgi:hypothetical protein
MKKLRFIQSQDLNEIEVMTKEQLKLLIGGTLTTTIYTCAPDATNNVTKAYVPPITRKP